MNKRKLAWVVILSVAAAIIAYGYYQYNRGPVDISKGEAIGIRATELYKEYTTDTARAGKKYSGKIIEITGEVGSSSAGTGSKQVILLESGQAGASINCTMEKSGHTVQPGRSITLRGMVTGMGETDDILGIPGDVYLDRCILMNP